MKTKAVIASAVAMAFAAALALPAAAATDGTSTQATTPKTNSGPMGKGTGYTGGNDFKSMDANGDGKVSREEYMHYYENDWTQMDSSKSGSLSSDQYQKYNTERQMKRSDGSPQQPGQNR